MFEKDVVVEEWPEAKVRVQMMNAIQVTDFSRAMDPAGRGLPMAGADILRFFRETAVNIESAPLMDGKTFSGSASDDRVAYVVPGFMFNCCVQAMKYSELEDEETKN